MPSSGQRVCGDEQRKVLGRAGRNPGVSMPSSGQRVCGARPHQPTLPSPFSAAICATPPPNRGGYIDASTLCTPQTHSYQAFYLHITTMRNLYG